MTAARACLALLFIGVIGLVLVHLRVERLRLEAEAAALRTQMIELRREVWAIQMEKARLRTPTQIRDRVQWLNLPIQMRFDAPAPAGAAQVATRPR